MSLTARTRRLPGADIDLTDVAGESGIVFERGLDGLAGRGEALRIEVESVERDSLNAVTEALAAFEVDDEVGRPGTGPVAFAALPFDRDRPATFIVPEVIVGHADNGDRWVTTIGSHERPLFDPGQATVRPRPRQMTVSATRDTADWMELVATATKAISEDAFAKVVLARELRVEADRPLSRLTLLRRLRSRFPGCHLFAVGSMIGASPELLVSRTGELVRAHPMAGTAPRGGSPAEDTRLAATLLASVKDRAEHQITIDMVWETLLPFCSYVDSEPEPSIVAVANVQHLASMVEGRLSSPPASVLDLVAALHPTPAVAGWPVAASLAFLRDHEDLDRDSYAGAVGWVDAHGNGAFAVGIRSAVVDGTSARLFAGVGVVADSDPVAELAETDAKFQAMLSALIQV